MINTVTFRIIPRKHGSNGTVSLNAQCFVNKARVVVPLSIYVEERFFDHKAQLIKVQHPQAMDYNSIISNARERAVKVLAEANKKDLRLDRETFRMRFTHTISDLDFVRFWEEELESRKGSIEPSTWKQQYSSLKKFKQFRPVMPFDMLSPGLLDDYEKFLRKRGNNQNTISGAMAKLKTYINLALRKGVEIKNPFNHYKIRSVTGRLVFLKVEEQHTLIEMYDTHLLPEHLQESLLTFLVQCFTSLRVSDVKTLNEKWLKAGEIEFMPRKTKRYNKVVRFSLPQIALRLLKDFFRLRSRKGLKSEQRINDDLKIIAAKANIDKSITTHVARHTFATTFIYLGGDVTVLQDIMGHSRIETTMRYVKVVDERKTEQMGNFNNEFK